MDADIMLRIFVTVACTLVLGLCSYVLLHTVNRRIHLNGRTVVDSDMFEQRLGSLERHLADQISAVHAKLDALESYTTTIDRRIELLMRQHLR